MMRHGEASLPSLAFPDPDQGRWRDTLALIRLDLARQVAHLNQGAERVHPVWGALLPGFQALLWHRVARCLLLKGWKAPAALISLIAMYLTRAELPPTSSIGPSALLVQALGVCIRGRVGARLTVRRDCLITHAGVNLPAPPAAGGSAAGSPADCPELGDDVALGPNAAVLGPVCIGSGAHIGPGAVVVEDVPSGGVVVAARARILRWGEQEDKTS